MLCEGVSKIETGGSSDTPPLHLLPSSLGTQHQHTRAAKYVSNPHTNYVSSMEELSWTFVVIVIMPVKISVQFGESKSTIKLCYVYFAFNDAKF